MKQKKELIELRNAKTKDIPKIEALVKKVYPLLKMIMKCFGLPKIDSGKARPLEMITPY